jgi:hypothetical protein
MVDCLNMLGRTEDARQMLERLLSLRNDLGLLSEEYDPVAGRLVGNFPQAFSHVSLVNSVAKLNGHEKPVVTPHTLSHVRRATTRSKTGTGRMHLGGHSLRRPPRSAPGPVAGPSTGGGATEAEINATGTASD